jgi:hypothetical protein
MERPKPAPLAIRFDHIVERLFKKARRRAKSLDMLHVIQG